MLRVPNAARYLLAAMATLASVTAAAGGAGTITLGGTASAAKHPEADAVIWLDANEPRPRDLKPVVLDQRDLAFSPHVLAVRVGTVVQLPNDDRVFHNVFSFHDGKKFDLGLYPVGTSRSIVFDQRGLSRIFCNIHPNMAAYVMAVDTPYFAVTDRRGRYLIEAVPPGTYRYHAWRAGAEEVSGSIDVRPGAVLDVSWP
jgi:plastocyanin